MRKGSHASESHLFGQLKELVGGPMAKMRAGVVDAGANFVATVKDISGNSTGPNLIHKTFRDVWVHVVDVLTGHASTARLFAPAGALWRLPKAGDGAYVVRGRKADGPGGALAMVDGGDGSTDNVVPGFDDGSTLDTNNAGIFLPEGFHVESTKDRVRIVANSSGTKSVIELQKGGKITVTAASGQVVEINGNTYSLPQWDAFATALTAATAAIKLITAATDPATVITLANGIRTAFIALDTAMNTNSNYKSINAKNG